MKRFFIASIVLFSSCKNPTVTPLSNIETPAHFHNNKECNFEGLECPILSKTILRPDSIPYYKTGDTLAPDYVLNDTLIVVDAVNLNKNMAWIEQGYINATDSELHSIFYKFCELKK